MESSYLPVSASLPVSLQESPSSPIGGEGVAFTLHDVVITPDIAAKKQQIKITGSVKLFGLKFLGLAWVLADIKWPKKFLELSSPVSHHQAMAFGGNFTIDIPEGLEREGEHQIDLMCYLGPTVKTAVGPISSATTTIPPLPSLGGIPTITYLVSGELPPEDQKFSVDRPILTSTEVFTSSKVQMKVLVTSTIEEVADVKVRLEIHHSNIWGSAGSLIKTVTSPLTQFQPGEAKEFPFEYTEIAEGGGRDTVIDVLSSGTIVGTRHDQDIFKVTKPTSFDNITEFKIVSYGKVGEVPVLAGEVLEIGMKDVCRINLSFYYKGTAITGSISAALWEPSWFDPHNEKVAAQKDFNFTGSIEPVLNTLSIDIDLKGVDAGREYGLYAKIDGISGPDVVTEFLSRVVKISGGVEPGVGDITSVFIDKAPEGSGIKLPTTVVADGNSFELGIRAKNTSLVTYTAGVEIKVYSPNNVLRLSPPINYTGLGPSEELLWKNNICKVDKVGDWLIKLRFITDDAVVLDEKEVIMTAISVSSQYSGLITSAYINKSPEGSNIPLPTTVKSDGRTFEVGFRYRNTSSVTYDGGVEVKVYDPSNVLRANPAVDYTGMAAGEELRKEYNITNVDKVGSWRIEARFLEKVTGKVLETKSYVMTAEAVVPTNPVITNVRVTSYPTSPIKPGDPILIVVSFDYIGPATTQVLHGALGQIGAGFFDEISGCTVDVSISIPARTVVSPLTCNATVPTKLSLSNGYYDLYAKLGGVISPQLNNVIQIQAQYSGLITSALINKGGSGSHLYLPYTVKADGQTFEVAVKAQNTSPVTCTAGVEIKVYNPDNTLVFNHSANYTGMGPDEELTWGMFNVGAVNKVGSWRVEARFLEKTTGKVLDSKQFVMTAISAVTPSLTISTPSIPTGGTLKFSFTGFSPNTSVGVSVVGGGGISIISNSSGAGSGSFVNGDPPGSYTLRAIDSAGNSATASFIITAPTTPAITNVKMSGIPSSPIKPGNPIPVTISFDYVGPATSKAFHAALGQHGWTFDEISGCTVDMSVSIPACSSKTNLSFGASIPTKTSLANGTYDLYCKLGGVGSPFYDDMVTIQSTMVPTLTISNPSIKRESVLYFSFAGFAANVAVWVGVEGGGGANITSNSSGAGSGAFRIGEAPGTYTLRANDSYGHSASASFSVYS